MTMTHPGLPVVWAILVTLSCLAYLFYLNHKDSNHSNFNFTLIKKVVFKPRVLFSLKLLMVLFFLTIIVSGLYGTSIAERNFATLMTWNLWWAGLVFSVLFFGSAWCAICPWDAIAQWLVRRRLWRRAEPNNSLNIKVPAALKTVWPALFIFVAFTWLELGVGVTVSPYATALISLLMVVLATLSLAVFKRKAFCRNFCPIGRTIGFYSQLSLVELRPLNSSVCTNCTTLDCYHGNDSVEPCPTGLVMGSLSQNSYCTSCGNCTQSCPSQNISWRLRSPSIEAIQTARPHWDEAWFMLVLLALTAFHGITMLSFWESSMSTVARLINDSGQLLRSFSLGFMVTLIVTVGLYSLAIQTLQKVSLNSLSFKQGFSSLAFISLPLAFSYHMAHNLNHLIREGGGLWQVIINPLGLNTLPLTMAEKHQRHLDLWLPQDVLFALQSGLMIFGVIIALKTVRARGIALTNEHTNQSWILTFAPVLIFIGLVTAFHLWMLMQPMIMRM